MRGASTLARGGATVRSPGASRATRHRPAVAACAVAAPLRLERDNEAKLRVSLGFFRMRLAALAWRGWRLMVERAASTRERLLPFASHSGQAHGVITCWRGPSL